MEGTVEVATTLRTSIHQVQALVLFDPGSLFGVVDGDTGEVRSTLAVESGTGPSVNQEVTVELGSLQPRAGTLALAVSWEPTAWQRLFPSFVGELEATPHGSGTYLRLHGKYGVPLDPLGRFGDGIAGRRVARQSLAAFLEQVARRIDAEAVRRAEPGPWSPSRYPVAVRELAGSENYVG